MKYFIFGSVITLLFSICIFLYIENTSLSASLKTYKNNKEVIDKDYQKAKEDYFIQQQSDNTSLILFTVTVLFTMFATFTFIGVKSEFDSAIKKNDKRYESAKSDYEKSVIHISNLKSSVSFQYADRINKDFSNVLLEKPLDTPKLIELGLLACQNYCYTISYSSNDTQELKASVLHYVVPILNVMVEKVNATDTVKLKSISYEMFLVIKNSFDLVLDKDNLQKFSIIFSKLSFIESEE